MDRSGKNWEPELFRCTMVGAGNFTTKERMFYETNGYILRKKLIPLDILQRCRIRCSDLCKGETQKGWTRVTMDSTESTWLLIEDVLWDPAFSHLVLHPPLLNAVESITGPNIIATDSIMFPTIGHVSDIAAPFSREFDQIRIRPEHRIACTWTVVDNFNEEKRSLSIIPGTHKKIANPEEYGEPKISWCVGLPILAGLICQFDIIQEKHQRHH
ncbi:phytanoyl-CoA dioxygenase, peroxisomal-like [Cimex lectularius]|uniref:phytanoyl-CoA dioxygenase n=1 Tax=Cimex lectularius TaxID=79782 RepID=A0A8I6TIK6_CIMLE|nr:phytanoyl-CoA dioxygenase, peroxisomal-like [Cimex lectularius]